MSFLSKYPFAPAYNASKTEALSSNTVIISKSSSSSPVRAYSYTGTGPDFAHLNGVDGKSRGIVFKIVNCDDVSNKTVNVKLYRKTGGIYYYQNSYSVTEGYTRAVSLYYYTKKFNRVDISTYSGSNYVNKFGGWVMYRGY